MPDKAANILARWEHAASASGVGDEGIRCSRCGQATDRETRFCPYCGSFMCDRWKSRWIRYRPPNSIGVTLSRCGDCGLTVNRETPFCPYCGASMTDDKKEGRIIRVYDAAETMRGRRHLL